MKTYTLSSRNLPMDDTWDVIVVGGGPSGSTAATAAAREGARTLLIEGTGALGGMGTNALVPAWCPFSDKKRVIYGGLAERILRASKRSTPHVPEEKVDWVPISPEDLKRIYEEMVLEAGAEILFHTSLAAVEKRENDEVDAILVVNKGGLSALRSKVYIDCTGDADLCFMAGAETVKGDGGNEPLMAATHCFVLANVNEAAYRDGPNLHPDNPESPIYAIIKSGRYPRIPDTHVCSNLIGPSTVGFNAGHVYDYDNTDPRSVSQGLPVGRKLAKAYRDALAEFFPAAFGNAYLVLTGSLMGVRETRRVMGDYVLTLDDYLQRRSFPDEISRNCYYIDIHQLSKPDQPASEEEREKDRRKLKAKYGPGESHGIPYRCLTPKGLANVLVAGRCISTERLVQGSVRVMPSCLAMGEAAGLAAALTAFTPRPDVHSLESDRLRSRLQDYGAYLPDSNPCHQASVSANCPQNEIRAAQRLLPS
ncbi:MAG: FAD-dependent oxidoreductase [Opitutales bacterium]|nr:FAD-dependent oxidoreductase [Opitutales bacterium]